MNILTYFKNALAAQLSPTLLEFSHPIKKTPLVVCGIKPKTTLLVKHGLLYKNSEIVGSALDIFEHLTLANQPGFFPAFLGFFAYEFARYFGYPTKDGGTCPDALFRLYEQGVVIDNRTIIHHDPIDLHRHGVAIQQQPSSFTPALTHDQFCEVVQNIQERIRSGDVYQVNFSMPFHFAANTNDMLSIYEAMRTNNPSPFMGIVAHEDVTILSGSPERLFSLNNHTITTRPIAGTKKRGIDHQADDDHMQDLTSCPKENAEHVMLVDLLRNDLNHISEPGSVVVDEDRTVEFYSHVMHLVSEISGYTTQDLKEIMRAIFPGGTITGAPKQSVMKAIMELENSPRGAYTGSLGYISAGYGVDFNILIRSVVRHGDRAWINAGAGIVIDSIPEREWLEINAKAQAVLDILQGIKEKKPARAMIKGRALVKTPLSTQHADKRVLFVENHDSFSFNIVEALRSLGALVEVVVLGDIASGNTALSTFGQRGDRGGYNQLVIGPGPGNPQHMLELSALIDNAIHLGLPLLGICLGHQALGYHFGASITRAPRPIHGQTNPIYHFGRGLFAGLSSPACFTRYHSLVIDSAPAGFIVDAFTDDDCIMAIRHNTLPLFGLQFHPESYVSTHGLALLRQFLRAPSCQS